MLDLEAGWKSFLHMKLANDFPMMAAAAALLEAAALSLLGLSPCPSPRLFTSAGDQLSAVTRGFRGRHFPTLEGGVTAGPPAPPPPPPRDGQSDGSGAANRSPR